MKKKMNELFKKPIVIVKWRDAVAFNDNYPVEHEFEPNPCESVGRLFSKTKKSVTIIRDIYGDNPEEDMEVSGAIVIPKDWVVSIKIVKEF